MKLGPRYKICKGSARTYSRSARRKVLRSPRSALRRLRKRKGRRNFSDFGRQLIEKQKLRLTYGLTEKQFAGYVEKSLESGANPQAFLFGLLESRLDSIAYRMGLVSTRRASRQLVSHGHLLVNGRRTTVPSYQVSPGTMIAIREGSRDSGLFADLADRLKEYHFPAWVTFDVEKREGSFCRHRSYKNRIRLRI